jgi:hypothetical protein
MAYFAGQTNVIIHGPLRVWPENGLICIEDSRDNSYKTESVKDCLEKIQGLSDMVKGSLDRKRTRESAFYADELALTQRLIEKYVDICKIARDQGEPSNKDTASHHRRKRKTVVARPNVIDMDNF